MVATVFDDPDHWDSRVEPTNAALDARIARLPFVEVSATSVGFDGNIGIGAVIGVHPHVTVAETAPPPLSGVPISSRSIRQTLIAGYLFDSRHPNEAVVNAQAAQEMGVHVGSVIRIPFYTDKE